MLEFIECLHDLGSLIKFVHKPVRCCCGLLKEEFNFVPVLGNILSASSGHTQRQCLLATVNMDEVIR